jgi:hypothetical protein
MVPPPRASGKDALEASAWPGAVAMVGSMAYLMDDETARRTVRRTVRRETVSEPASLS